jgi:GMP synthase (glutamine-hydrolysing)
MRVSALIHAPFEGLGAIHIWLQKNGYSLKEFHPYRDGELPDLDDFDWLIVMGGPQDSKALEKYSYLRHEINLISRALSQNKLILGICLGAQLISESLGAKVEASPEREIGVFPLQLTEQGFADPIMRHFPDQFPVAHWHNDMPGIPAGAAILATSQGCPRQIIRFKPGVYGLQCHLELTIDNITKMIEHESELNFGRYAQTKEELLQHNYAAINQLLFLFLDNFIKTTAHLPKLTTV